MYGKIVQAAQQAEEMGHALEVLQKVSAETCDAIRKSRMRVAADSSRNLMMVIPLQQAATDLDKKKTSHIQILLESLLKMSEKNSVASKPQQVYSADKTRSHGRAKLLFAERAGPTVQLKGA